MTYSTFPLRAFSEIAGCNCDKGLECPTIGKHPACDWKTEDEAYPGVETLGIGIRTGSPSGCWVLDVDIKPEKGVDGYDSLAKLGILPQTRTVVSPSGSRHFYFLLPDFIIKNSGGKLGLGLDVRGEGGFVVAPHSPHKKGGHYKVEHEGPIVPAPEWLLEKIQALGVPVTTETTSIIAISKHHKDYGYRVAIARKFLADAPPCLSDGSSSANLMSMAQHLMVKLELPGDKALELVQELFNPRCDPPWAESDLTRALTNAAKAGMGIRGVAPEGWSLASPPRVQPLEDVEVAERQIKNPEHEYTFAPGQACNGKAYKTGFAEIVSDLMQLPDWAGVLQYDEFGDKIIAVNPPMKLQAEKTFLSDGDLNAIRCWFEVVAGKLVGKDMMKDAIDTAALSLTFHPVKDYLESLPKVEDGYLDVFARYVFGAIEPIQVEFVKMALVSAVKRIYEPGCYVKSMLILYGNQNAGKSSFCKKLFGKWFKEDISDLKSKDAMQELLGVWGLEMAEMDSISRAEVKTSKSFVSKATDRYRPSYGHCQVERPRCNIFIGTTNENDFLRDPSGASRYMPIEVPADMPTDWDRDEVWSAAYQLYRSGYVSYLATTEQQKQADKIREINTYQDPWTQHIEKAVMGKTRVSALQIAMIILPEATQLDGRAMSRVQSTLKKICGSSYRRGDDKTHYYEVPVTYQNAKAPAHPLDKLKPS